MLFITEINKNSTKSKFYSRLCGSLFGIKTISTSENKELTKNTYEKPYSILKLFMIIKNVSHNDLLND